MNNFIANDNIINIFNFGKIDNNIEDFNLIGGNDNMEEKSISKGLDIIEPLKRNDSDQSIKFYEKENDRKIINRNCQNNEEKARLYLINDQDRIVDKNEPEIENYNRNGINTIKNKNIKRKCQTKPKKIINKQCPENIFHKNNNLINNINKEDNIIENKIIPQSKEKNIENQNESNENELKINKKSNRVKALKPNLSKNKFNDEDYLTHQNKKEQKNIAIIKPIKKESILNKNDNYKNNDINKEINYLNDDDDFGNLIINENINENQEKIKKKKIENDNENGDVIKISKIKDVNNENPYIINRKKAIDNNNEPYKLKRVNAFCEKKTYHYFKIYDKINIFNSILLMINYNSLVRKYFLKKRKIEIKEEIIEYEKNNKNCLSSILYYLFKYLWDIKNVSDIPEKYLLEKYYDFISSTKENYFYEVKNIEQIINFIYSKINREFSDIYNNRKMKENPCHLYQSNISFIYDYFFGFYNNDTHYQMSKNNYCDLKEYVPFSYINFNLEEIVKFYNLANQIINLDNCFNYKSQISSLFSFPYILTIILSNNENCIFKLQDEIDLKKYVPHIKGNEMKYLLVSILCQNKNKDFIVYNFNHQNGLWYCYSNGRKTKVKEMDIKAIPLVLIYQSISQMDFEYFKLKIVETIKLKIKHMDGREKYISFKKDYTINQVIRKIANEFNLDFKKNIILINGKKPNDEDKLSEVVKDVNNCILVNPI